MLIFLICAFLLIIAISSVGFWNFIKINLILAVILGGIAWVAVNSNPPQLNYHQAN